MRPILTCTRTPRKLGRCPSFKLAPFSVGLRQTLIVTIRTCSSVNFGGGEHSASPCTKNNHDGHDASRSPCLRSIIKTDSAGNLLVMVTARPPPKQPPGGKAPGWPVSQPPNTSLGSKRSCTFRQLVLTLRTSAEPLRSHRKPCWSTSASACTGHRSAHLNVVHRRLLRETP